MFGGPGDFRQSELKVLGLHRTYSFPGLTWADGGGVAFGNRSPRPQGVQNLFPQVSLRFEEVTTLPVLSLTQEPHSRGSTGVPERGSCVPLQGKQACKAVE